MKNAEYKLYGGMRHLTPGRTSAWHHSPLASLHPKANAEREKRAQRFVWVGGLGSSARLKTCANEPRRCSALQSHCPCQTRRETLAASWPRGGVESEPKFGGMK